MNNMNMRNYNMSTPPSVDQGVGSRMRCRRIAIGLSQEKLAEDLGTSVYQVNSWEEGSVRLPPDQMLRIGKLLGVNSKFFFAQADPIVSVTDNDTDKKSSFEIKSASQLIMATELSPLMRGFSGITNSAAREAVINFVEAMAAALDETNSKSKNP